jgi:hypothetical protein
MKKPLLLLLWLVAAIGVTAQEKSIQQLTEQMQAHPGFFSFYWDETSGSIWLEIDRLEEEFLYVNSLAAGVGSNDIGLDRGQLGGEHVVKFTRSGPKIMLVQINLDFRAVSDNPDERQSVEEAFAQSILWGGKIEAEENGRLLVDITSLLLSDAHGVVSRLAQSQQGNYRLDADRSAIYLPRSKSFPQNTEFEATLTFAGSPQGRYVREVVPSPDAITVRQHHSFIQLPDNQYQMREMDPRSGFFGISYQDYATPISAPLVKRFINRHRLEKKDPAAEKSEAVEPIVYYLDRGAPEPIRSALMEGASWWNQAFEAAGYENAFQVKLLPPDADPMDVRYNLIQWVHRSTRGWSYGSSISDPRTGEILKGHVSLGSLRVRQDFLIAQGLVEAYQEDEAADPRLLEMALARLRQLSAHEVGHTLGLAHNFSASVDERASVMDYPHPYVEYQNRSMDFSEAYAVGIGAWDKRAILYGYQDFPAGTEEAQALQEILKETIGMDLHFLSDQDARPQGGADPLAHLWDNGATAAKELERIMEVREAALKNFGEENIGTGRPLAELEEVLVPIYFAHRYQVEAAVKVIGGMHYTYAVRGDGQTPVEIVSANAQEEALEVVLGTLEAEFLAIPTDIMELIPPRAYGYNRGRENFRLHTEFTLDPLAAAEASANHSLGLLLHPARAARLVEFHARDQKLPGLEQVLEGLIEATLRNQGPDDPYLQAIHQTVSKVCLHHLLTLANHPDASPQVKAMTLLKAKRLEEYFLIRRNNAGVKANRELDAHYLYCLDQIRRFNEDPSEWEAPASPPLPDGSPIGCGR